MTICRDFAWVIDRGAEGQAGTCGIKIGGPLELIGNVLSGESCRECLNICVARLGRVENETSDGHETGGRADADKPGGGSVTVLWTKHILEPNSDETHRPAETADDEAEGHLFSPCLLLLLVVKAANRTEEDAWGPEGDNTRKNLPRVEAA